MPISDGTGHFSLGRDCQIVLVGPFGQVQIDNVTSFQAQQQTANVKVDRLDGVQLRAELPKGWQFTIEAERGSSGIEDLFALMESDWYTSGTLGVSTLYQYITEPDGSSSTYQQDNCSLKLTDAGTWKGDSSVKQTITGECNRRRRV